MKQFSAIFYAGLTAIMVMTLLSFGLPVIRAQASPDTAAPSAAPSAIPAVPAQPACDPSRTVQVSGSAVINVIPDRTLIQLGVQSNGPTPEAVEAANSAAIQQVINAVRFLGVDPKDIATDLYVIEPVYEDYDALYIKGYRIHNVVAITLRNVNKTSQVIAAALEAGANQVVNVDLYTSELRKYRDQARDLAMKAAAEKAQALAGAVAAQTSCVLSINENSWSSYNGWWYARNQNQMTQNTVQNAAPAAGTGTSEDAETVSLGQISVRAEVGVTFSLK
jgi:uncharacterized protein